MKKLALTLGSVALLPQAALAHVGDHGASLFVSGVMHPLGGTDHVLAMVAVGLWAAVTAGRALWALPLGFVGAMLAGGALGAMGLVLPGVEPMILASIVLLGVAAALAWRAPLAVGVGIVAAFGLFHGHAQGTEGPAAGLLSYGAGFAFATMALHGAGVALGLGLNALSVRGAARAFGAGTAVAGLALTFA
ncbi:MAG: HupE/UreJ family protein [Pseudotabrizicola sp.]|uniref:HupE/UreJ family protein n=1 Tax=Pseudotabrizicola sp. TaxID=2939647 RepID=UPI00273204DE|nr:HupE/UreJ family protein [Pseudotabrizicola sp.]MDP2081478.1 HupE/UreJ family protein [Pseudotabrizicola sp.]MDZ7572991.1 HupE/UreJ family protein [Pseudotabrizicola sp.]